MWGQAKTARAGTLHERHRRPALRMMGIPLRMSGQPESGLAPPRAACHRLVQRVAGSDVQPRSPCSPAVGIPGSVQEMDAETVWSTAQPVLRRGNG